MEVVCPLCAARSAVAEPSRTGGDARCPACGARLSPGESDSREGPRDQLDTIPLDSGSLRRLTTISRADEAVDSLLDAPQAAAEPAPESQTRPPQLTVPFELRGAEPVPLARPPQASVAFDLTRPPEEDLAGPSRPKLGVWIVLLLLLVVAATLASGRL